MPSSCGAHLMGILEIMAERIPVCVGEEVVQLVIEDVRNVAVQDNDTGEEVNC